MSKTSNQVAPSYPFLLEKKNANSCDISVNSNLYGKVNSNVQLLSLVVKITGPQQEDMDKLIFFYSFVQNS